MTSITKIKLNGFKSFPKSIEIPFEADFSCVLGPNGSGKSCHYNTKVLLSNGKHEKIGKIVEDALSDIGSKFHERLEDGIFTRINSKKIEVIALNLETLKTEYIPVSAFIKRIGEPVLYKIKTASGREVTTTGCHPVIVFKDRKVQSSLVRDLKNGDIIATPRLINIKSKNVIINYSKYYLEHKKPWQIKEIKIPEHLSPELARFVGYLIGDGYIARNRVELVNQDQEVLDDFISLANFLFGLKNSQVIKLDKATRVIFDSVALIDFLYYLFDAQDQNSLTSLYKNVPSIIFEADNYIVSSFLSALFDCDAYVSRSVASFEYVSKNKGLVSQVQELLLRFGILSTIKSKKKAASNTKAKIKRDYYSLYSNGKFNFEKLFNNLYMRCYHKQKRIEFYAKLDNIPNQNIDLLPKEVNKLVKLCKESLCISYKPLRKKYPILAAYIENRCCPTRQGIQEINFLFKERLIELRGYYSNIKKDSKILFNTLKEVGISGAEVSVAVGVTQHAVTDTWYNQIYEPRPENLDKVYSFTIQKLETMIYFSQNIIDSLDIISQSDIFWDPISEINEMPGEKYVYDLSVSHHHNFIANNIFVHNSNISDAICFVLGRLSTKSLRADKSSHLIYNGGKAGSPSKHAEVSIFFDNSKKDFAMDQKEIKITRIVKQSGQSVYKINDKTVTRQQVIDMLSSAKINPEGYNIVSQGDIVKFMEMKGEERRHIIEDIAGISVYEEKKQKALHELEGVQVKLSEAEIILTERETNLKELKKDRDQARKYQDAQQNIKDNKATLISMQLREKEAKRDEFESKIKEITSKVESLNKQIEQSRSQITLKKEEINQINAEIEQKGEKDQFVLRKQIEELKTDIIKHNARIDTLSLEIKKIDERKIQLKSSIEDSNKEILALREKRKELEANIKEGARSEEAILKEIKVFRDKNNLGDMSELSEKVDEIEQKIEQDQINITKLQEQKIELIRQKDKSEFALAEIEKTSSRLKEAEKENKDKAMQLKDLRAKFKEVIVNLSKAQNEDSAYLSTLSSTRRKYVEQNEELQKLKARSIGVREGLAYDGAIKKIKSLGDKKVYGTVSELGNVPTKYSLALEVAAGPRINSIVVEDDATAARLIKVLKENRVGIATFLPLNKIKSRVNDTSLKSIKGSVGVIGFAVDLIKFNSKFKDVFSYVFGSTLVVESVDVARRIGIGRARMVSLDGDLMDVSGAMIGGFRRKEGMGFAQQELDKNISLLEVEVKRIQNLIDNIEQKRIDLDENIISLKTKKSELESDILKIEKTLGIIDGLADGDSQDQKATHLSNLKQADLKIKELSDQVSKLESGLKKLKEQRDNLRDKLTPDHSFSLKLSEMEEKRDSIRNTLMNQRGELNNLLSQVERIHTPEIARTEKIIKDQEKEKESFKTELEDLSKIVKAKSLDLKEKERQESEFYGKFKSMAAKRTKISEIISKLDNSIVLDLDRIKEMQSRLNNINIDRAKIVAEIEGLNKENEAYVGAKIRRGILIDDLRGEIKEQEKILASLGNVNLRALEIYEGLEKELLELQEKVTKLKVEKEDVLKMMGEIEEKKKDIFMDNFKEIATRFKQIYSEIATKWEAYLDIENSENPFEGGVDIKVRITGNKYLDIKGLSGGEKTLCALSFIFAIQEFDPASFYLFDEVDAALDKHNSEKLSKLISKYSARAQYIVISHNDAIISEASKIYGVSMQNGVSKVVSLKV